MSGVTTPPSELPPGGQLNSSEIALFFLGGIVAYLVLGVARYLVESIRSRYLTAANEFQEALDSTDLKTLGNYLRSRLGSLTVKDYVGKSLPRDRVDTYVSRLREFLAADDSGDGDLQVDLDFINTGSEWKVHDLHIKDMSGLTEGRDPETVFVKRASDPPILEDARRMVAEGELWTALATLREDIQDKLRSSTGLKKVAPIDVSHFFGREVARNYERFRRVANRAIHGHEVQLESARAAMNSARVVYNALEAQPQVELNL